MSATRLLSRDDAEPLARLLQSSRDFIAPWEPIRPENYFSIDGQRDVISEALALHGRSVNLPHVILDESGQVVGRVTLNEIIRGPFQSCSVGYWLSEDRGGKGLATAAVREMSRIAFDDLLLHRIQAGTLKDNQRSQRVLQRCNFIEYGMAPNYLKIAGKWQDHILYQLISAGVN